MSEQRVTVTMPAPVTRRGRTQWVVTVRYGARVNHERFPAHKRVDADAFVERLVDEGAELIAR